MISILGIRVICSWAKTRWWIFCHASKGKQQNAPTVLQLFSCLVKYATRRWKSMWSRTWEEILCRVMWPNSLSVATCNTAPGTVFSIILPHTSSADIKDQAWLYLTKLRSPAFKFQHFTEKSPFDAQLDGTAFCFYKPTALATLPLLLNNIQAKHVKLFTCFACVRVIQLSQSPQSPLYSCCFALVLPCCC